MTATITFRGQRAAGDVLVEGRSAKLPREQDEGVVKQTAPPEVLDEARKGFIVGRAHPGELLLDPAMMVPAIELDLDEANAQLRDPPAQRQHTPQARDGMFQTDEFFPARFFTSKIDGCGWVFPERRSVERVT